MMKLKDLNKDELAELARVLKKNPEHLAKIARGERDCTAKLAMKIEKATGGLIPKESVVTWE